MRPVNARTSARIDPFDLRRFQERIFKKVKRLVIYFDPKLKIIT